MGFWDIAKKVGKVAGAAANEFNDRFTTALEKASSCSDEELFSTIRRGGSFERAASLQELKNRGYDEDEIKERYRG